jgi:hypothetical protein
MAKRLAELVATKIAADYPDQAGKKKVSQARIAKDIGTVQPVLSEILAAKGGVGVGALLVLRAWLKMPLDEMLGLPPLPSQLSQAVVEAMDTIERRRLTATAPPMLPPHHVTPPTRD